MVQQFHLDNLVVLVPLVAQVVLAAQVDQAHLVVPVVLEVLEVWVDLVVPQAQEEPVAPVVLGDQVDLEDQEG